MGSICINPIAKILLILEEMIGSISVGVPCCCFLPLGHEGAKAFGFGVGKSSRSRHPSCSRARVHCLHALLWQIPVAPF